MYIKYCNGRCYNSKIWGLADSFEEKPLNMARTKPSFQR